MSMINVNRCGLSNVQIQSSSKWTCNYLWGLLYLGGIWVARWPSSSQSADYEDIVVLALNDLPELLLGGLVQLLAVEL